MRPYSYLRPFLILMLTSIFLGIASLVDVGIDNPFVSTKKTDVLADLRSKPRPGSSLAAGNAVDGNDGKTGPDETRAGQLTNEKNDPSAIHDYGLTDGGSLGSFFKALLQAEKKGGKVRIAYFGDSLIEGDLITQDIRSVLQKRFGGRGVGFVPVTSVTAGFRRTIHHTFSDNWRSVSILKNPGEAGQPGISGFLFIPRAAPDFGNTPMEQLARKADKASWVKYKATDFEHSGPVFDSVDLFYENPGPAAALCYDTGDGGEDRIVMEPTTTVSKKTLIRCRSQRSVKVSFFPGDLLKIYGFSFETDHGAYVDNFSLRGSSGVDLAKISCKMFSDFNRIRDYKLVVLHYGPNIANHTMTDFTWYRSKMVRVVNHLKQCLPGTSIIVVSVNDICSRREDGLSSAPCVPYLVDAQREVARETGVGFWNLYKAMGGPDSMAGWVRSKRPMASPDCTHFNITGARNVGNMFSAALLAEYDRFRANLVEK